jgi:hypothetical protein
MSRLADLLSSGWLGQGGRGPNGVKSNLDGDNYTQCDVEWRGFSSEQ